MSPVATWFVMLGPVVPPPPQLYINTYEANKHQQLNGSDTYRLLVPANVPTFWPVDVYDAATGGSFASLPSSASTRPPNGRAKSSPQITASARLNWGHGADSTLTVILAGAARGGNLGSSLLISFAF